MVGEILIQSRFIIVKKDYASVLRLFKILHIFANKKKITARIARRISVWTLQIPVC